MATLSPVGRRAAGLTGRRSESGVLDGLIEAVRGGGESRALVVRGEPGVGKTALTRDVLRFVDALGFEQGR
jgi:stage III sporulation protein SpoIIIAA